MKKDFILKNLITFSMLWGCAHQQGQGLPPIEQDNAIRRTDESAGTYIEKERVKRATPKPERQIKSRAECTAPGECNFLNTVNFIVYCKSPNEYRDELMSLKRLDFTFYYSLEDGTKREVKYTSTTNAQGEWVKNFETKSKVKDLVVFTDNHREVIRNPDSGLVYLSETECD